MYPYLKMSYRTLTINSITTFIVKVDNRWTTWTSWDTCTVTCGGGNQGRTRSCTNPAPQYGGANCVGASSENQACNQQTCISKYLRCNQACGILC